MSSKLFGNDFDRREDFQSSRVRGTGGATALPGRPARSSRALGAGALRFPWQRSSSNRASGVRHEASDSRLEA